MWVVVDGGVSRNTRGYDVNWFEGAEGWLVVVVCIDVIVVVIGVVLIVDFFVDGVIVNVFVGIIDKRR